MLGPVVFPSGTAERETGPPTCFGHYLIFYFRRILAILCLLCLVWLLVFSSYKPVWGGSDCTFGDFGVRSTAIDRVEEIPDHMMVICGKVLLVTVISFQRGFIVSDNLVNSFWQKGWHSWDPCWQTHFCHVHSFSVMPTPLSYQYVRCRFTSRQSQNEGRISTLTHIVYLTPVAHPFAFQQPQKQQKLTPVPGSDRRYYV